MRHYTFLLLLLLPTFSTLAQEPETLLVAVDYSFSHIHDTTNRSNPLKENMTLNVAAHTASYRRSPLIPTNTATTATAASSAGAAPTAVRVVAGGPMAVVYAPGYTEYELVQSPATNVLKIFTSIGMSAYVIEQPLPRIDWQIGQQTKTIGDYTCQQATGTYAGRQYIAWFTTELPFRYGPWKLSGLPGLILEAADANGEVSFTCLAIRKPTEETKHRYGRNSYIPASEQAVAKAKEAFEENPVATMQSQLPQGAPAPRLAYRDLNGKSTSGEDAQPLIDEKRKIARRFINNPLERK
ncbi:GLPGLI family protein [Paraflavitalea pollutisoli]|uniref:GLPGLI family protein n=1 Tax=Paraflavitalea pollutisoli TaxID=3034143 RepID=UPI0023EAE917|nr:GLPGLI family protein [Paraflavitalea sp. H1-2-19X]